MIKGVAMTDIARAGSTAAVDDEHSMVSAIAAGDRSAFEQLMRRYNSRLYRLARATLRDRTEAQDVLQDAYIGAYRSIGSFRGDSSLATWLSRLVLNECFARMRRNTRRQNVIPIVGTHLPADIEDDCELPDTAAGRSQMRELLERKIDELPETFRLVFMLRSVEELSVEETAATLDIPEETVRSRHFRAKNLLRESLARELNLLERDLFEFGGVHCDEVVANVLGRLTL
jgi:RNA polymerase sigma-70 factor (ECF subfamily)